jgi:GNAT superfamily N-acetyltransferase
MSERLRAREPWRVWTADDGGDLVGQVWLQTVEKLPNPVGECEHLAYLSNLYVTPAVRGKVGTELLKHVLDWAAEAGVERVVLWPTSRSRSLYIRHGFTDHVECVELRLTSTND